MRTLTILLASATLFATPARAQTSAVQQGLPTREEVRPPALQQQAPPASRLTVEGGVERAPCPLADARFAGITMTLTRVDFANLAPVDPALLAPAYADYIGKTVPIAAVCEIRDVAATLLRREGYLAAVQVPPQRIEGGVLKLDVLMAKLVGLRIRGETGKSEALLAAYLEKLKNGRPFNSHEAERSLLLARDLPGFDVRLTLKPAGTAPGEVVGDVIVTRIPAVLDLAIQNYGSPQVGRWTGFLRGEAYDLLGAGDRLSLGLFNTFDTREQTVLQAGYDLHLGGGGLTLGANYTYAWTHPSIGGGDPLKARTSVASFEAGYPLLRSQATTLRVAGGLDVIDQRLRFADTPLTTDRLRVLYARLDAQLVDPASLTDTAGFSIGEPRWRAGVSIELRKGTGLFEASDDCGAAPYLACRARQAPLSRLDGDPQAGLVRATASAEIRPDPMFVLALALRAQHAFDPVVSYEEFSGGNYTIGRGYDPGSIAGDDGLGLSIEARIGKSTPSGPNDVTIQPYAFFDAAKVWNEGPIAPPVRNERLTSIGGGVRVAWGDRARLDVTLAAPLERTLLSPQRDVRLLVTLTSRLFPWRPL